MPGTFILLIIVLVICIVLAIIRRSAMVIVRAESAREGGPERGVRGYPTRYDKALNTVNTMKWGYRGFLSLAGLILLISVLVIIPTKQVGVVTTFGAPSGTHGNGLHMVWPWQKVTTLDGAIQTDSHVDKNATKIRLGNQSTASVHNSVRWRIQPGRGDALYRDYRGFDKIRDSLVTRELVAALNEVFKDYDPLSTVKAGEGQGTSQQPSLKEFGDEVTKKLRVRVGDDVIVLSVIIPLVEFDGDTQERINAYQAEIANTRIAEQREKTAVKNAEANRRLAGSVSRAPNVLVSRCIEALETMIKKGQSVPAGFNCWPGGGSSLALPATRGK